MATLGRVKPGHPCCPSEMDSDTQRGHKGDKEGQGLQRQGPLPTPPPDRTPHLNCLPCGTCSCTLKMLASEGPGIHIKAPPRAGWVIVSTSSILSGLRSLVCKVVTPTPGLPSGQKAFWSQGAP